MKEQDVARFRNEFKEPHDLVKTSDGKTIFLRRWDAQEPLASLLVLHGITAHSRPYGAILGREIAREGFTVYGMDLRGHGLSDGGRGDYPSRDRLVGDLCETLGFVRGRSRKLVVLGHSLGVLSAIAAVNNCPEGIDGLVLLSAAARLRQGFFGKPGAVASLKSLLGVTFLRGTPLIEYPRSGMVGLQDPLFNFNYSARFMSTMYGVGALSVARMFRRGQVDSPSLKFSKKLTIPLFVGVGEKDEIFPVDSVRAFYDSIDCVDKEFAVIPDGRHAVFPVGCWGQLVDWLRWKIA
jgi:acylglycerol lipase